MINYKYQINLYSPFSENQILLKQLYLPIIGKDAVDLYNELRYEYNNNFDSIFEDNKNHETLLKNRNLKWEEFIELRKSLESVNLIKTYLNETTKTYYYVLNEPLNFDEFTTNNKMLTILKNRTTRDEFNKIQFRFNKFMQLSSMIDISESIDYLITETEKRDAFLYDFEKLYTWLSKKYHVNFKIPFETKKIIDDFFNENMIKSEVLYKFIDESIIKVEDKYLISQEILKSKINKFKSDNNEREILKRTKIKRDYKIFDQSEDLKKFYDVIDGYKQHSTENYIVIVAKECINNEVSSWINKLRLEYHFSDSYINAIVDYSIIKNKGGLHKNYILKIAQSINSKALNSLEEVIEYLRSTKMVTKTNNIISTINNQLELKQNKITTSSWLENEYNFADYDEEQLEIIKSIG